ARRLRAYMRPVRRPRERFITISPLALPGRGGARGWNDRLISFQIRLLARGLGIHCPIMWIETAAAPLASSLFAGPTVYQLSDKYELTRYASQATRARLAATSAALVMAADVVTCK